MLNRSHFSVLFFSAALVFSGASALAEDLRFFRIATGSAASTYFPVGAAIATTISSPPGSSPCDQGGSCGVPGLIAVAQTSEGSVANVTAVGRGLINSGLAQADIIDAAYNGTGTYFRRQPLPNLRVIANLYPESLHLVTRRGSDITKVRDLVGKRVSLDKPGSGTRVSAEIVLQAYGVQPNLIKMFEIDPSFATDLLLGGELDAFFIIAGYPAPAVSELASMEAIDLIPIVGPEVDRILRRHKFFGRDRIPPGVYEGLGSVDTLGVGAQLIVNAKAEEQLIYEITRALWDKRNRPLLQAGHLKATSIQLPTALTGISIPLHPGAIRYYKEIGFYKDKEREKEQGLETD